MSWQRLVRHDVFASPLAWARVALSTRHLFVETNHDLRRGTMLVSSGRSGSTWLSEAIAGSGRYRLMFEPLRNDVVPEAAPFVYGHYLPPDDTGPVRESAMRAILEGRVRHSWIDQFNDRRVARRRLVKQIRATNLLPWLVERFPEVPTIYLLRHPLAVAGSFSVLHWDDHLDEILDQRALLDGPLAPFHAVIDEARRGNGFERRVLQWCVENVVPLTMLPSGSVHVVFYESLVHDGAGELARLAAFLGTELGDPAVLDVPSKLSRPDSAVVVGGDRLSAWRDVVPPASVASGLAILRRFGLDRLYDDGLVPLVSAEALLPFALEPSDGRRTGREASAETPVA